MSACPELEGLLAERASGETSPEDAARVDAHVEACEGCRGELRVYRELFQMARLPPAEARVADLDVSTFSAYQRRRRRRVTGFTLGAGFVAAAVAASLVLAPALLTLRSVGRQPPAAAIAAVPPQQGGDYAYAGYGDDLIDASDSTFGAAAGSDEYQGSGGTQLAMSSGGSSESIDPEAAALAAFDEIDTP